MSEDKEDAKGGYPHTEQWEDPDLDAGRGLANAAKWAEGAKQTPPAVES